MGGPQVREWLDRDLRVAHGLHYRMVRYHVKIIHVTASGSATAIITAQSQVHAESLFTVAHQWFFQCPVARDKRGWMHNTCSWWRQQ